jgi:hypothetical protein
MLMRAVENCANISQHIRVIRFTRLIRVVKFPALINDCDFPDSVLHFHDICSTIVLLIVRIYSRVCPRRASFGKIGPL